MTPLTQLPDETISEFASRVRFFGDNLLKQPEPPWSLSYWKQLTEPRVVTWFMEGLDRPEKHVASTFPTPTNWMEVVTLVSKIEKLCGVHVNSPDIGYSEVSLPSISPVIEENSTNINKIIDIKNTADQITTHHKKTNLPKPKCITTTLITRKTDPPPVTSRGYKLAFWILYILVYFITYTKISFYITSLRLISEISLRYWPLPNINLFNRFRPPLRPPRAPPWSKI